MLPQEFFLSHHCIKNMIEEQNEWVHRMRMTDIRYIFILFFENGNNAIDSSDKTHRSPFKTAFIYLRRGRWSLNHLKYWLWGCALFPLSTGCIDFVRNLRRSVKPFQLRWPFPVSSEVLCPGTSMLGCNPCCLPCPVSVGPQFVSRSGETEFYFPCLPEL